MKKLFVALVLVLTLSACSTSNNESWRKDNIRAEMQDMKTYVYVPTIQQEMEQLKTR